MLMISCYALYLLYAREWYKAQMRLSRYLNRRWNSNQNMPGRALFSLNASTFASVEADSAKQIALRQLSMHAPRRRRARTTPQRSQLRRWLSGSTVTMSPLPLSSLIARWRSATRMSSHSAIAHLSSPGWGIQKQRLNARNALSS